MDSISEQNNGTKSTGKIARGSTETSEPLFVLGRNKIKHLRFDHVRGICSFLQLVLALALG